LEAISNSNLRTFLTEYQRGFKPGQNKWVIDGINLTPLEQTLGLSAVRIKALLRESQDRVIKPTTHPVRQGNNRGGKKMVNVPAFDRDRMLAFAALCFMYGEYKERYDSGNRQASDRRVFIGQIQLAHLAGKTREALEGSSLAELIGEPQFSGGLDRLRKDNEGVIKLGKNRSTEGKVPHPDLSEPFWQGEIGQKLANIIGKIQEQGVGFPIKTGQAAELYGLFLAGMRPLVLTQALARSGVIGNVETGRGEHLFSLWNFLTGGLILAHLQGGYSLEKAAEAVVKMVKGVNGLQEASGQINAQYASTLKPHWEGGWPYLTESSPWANLVQRVDLSPPGV